MKFPSVCIDDFYENPDSIREYALGLEYEQQTPYDLRSKHLSEINPRFFSDFCDKLISIFYTCPVQYKVYTAFHIHYRKNEDPNSVENKGWLHKDPNVFLGGVIYLTPNPNPNAGTSLYDGLKKDSNEIFRFNNRYNRLIAFDGANIPHRVTNRYMKEDKRLTQVFFIENISNLQSPLERLPKVKL